MRVAFISPFLFRCLRGIERFTVSLANALAEKGVEVHLITWREKSSWPWGNTHERVSVHALPLPRYFRPFWAGLAYVPLLLQLRADIVFLFFTWHGEEIAFRLIPTASWKTILALHYPAEEVPYRYSTLQRSVIPKIANQIVASSHYVADGVRQWLGRSPAMIHNGVDLNRFHPTDSKTDAKKKLNLPAESLVLTTVAVFEERKGVGKVLAALPQVIQNFKNVTYLVAGDGPEKEKLLAQTNALGLEKHVRFLGTVRDSLPLYHATDLFVFLSRGEASPLALLEAMACGLPLIAAQRPPLEEYASRAGTTFVDDNDPIQIAQAILELASDSARRAQMGQTNRQRVEQNFGWDVVAEQYLKLFESDSNASSKAKVTGCSKPC